LKEAGLRRLIGETKHGVADHAYLLQILLILELWQQENEGEGAVGGVGGTRRRML
jgi:hypothetical protein